MGASILVQPDILNIPYGDRHRRIFEVLRDDGPSDRLRDRAGRADVPH